MKARVRERVRRMVFISERGCRTLGRASMNRCRNPLQDLTSCNGIELRLPAILLVEGQELCYAIE